MLYVSQNTGPNTAAGMLSVCGCSLISSLIASEGLGLCQLWCMIILDSLRRVGAVSVVVHDHP